MEKKLFDLTVHHRDQKSQRIIEENPYVLHCHKDHGQVFERDGKFYDLQGVEYQQAPFPIAKKNTESKTVETKEQRK